MIVTGNQPDGTPTWVDLGIPDLDRAMAFYGSLFGWEFQVGPPDAPASAWATTFEVADTDAVVERAVAGGGRATDPEDFIYGRLASLTDPFGTEF
jgi:predicted enzyme related to lactoylglutathione lyase